MEYDSIDIDGPFIAIGGLKEKIVEHKNLRSATDIDLLITNAQTGEGEQVFLFHFHFWVLWVEGFFVLKVFPYLLQVVSFMLSASEVLQCAIVVSFWLCKECMLWHGRVSVISKPDVCVHVCVCVVASGVTIEYTDDSFLVPKNTSVIIKRVPASGPKPILRVDEQ
jgi:hypothetical protein